MFIPGSLWFKLSGLVFYIHRRFLVIITGIPHINDSSIDRSATLRVVPKGRRQPPQSGDSLDNRLWSAATWAATHHQEKSTAKRVPLHSIAKLPEATPYGWRQIKDNQVFWRYVS